MTNPTQTAQTVSDAANAEADAHFKACRPDEAVRVLDEFLDAGHALPAEELLRTRSNLATYELRRGNAARALEALRAASSLVDECRRTAPKMCGRFANALGATYLELKGDVADAEDLAIYWFTAASVFYEAAYEKRLQADVENNLAMVHVRARRVRRAMEHAANLMGIAVGSRPADEAVLAQYEDTRAQIALAEGDARRALDLANSSVRRLLNLNEPRLFKMSVETSMLAENAYLLDEEGKRIREVLDASDWNLTRAAHCLGFNSLQAFKHHLRRRFPSLEAERVNRSVQS
jgi:hypothetical protein